MTIKLWFLMKCEFLILTQNIRKKCYCRIFVQFVQKVPLLSMLLHPKKSPLYTCILVLGWKKKYKFKTKFSLLCDSTCSHGEWKCHYSTQCQKQKSRSCQIAVLGKKSQSDCPRGFFCKVQIPGIPEANIPDVAVCVPDDSSSMLTYE